MNSLYHYYVFFMALFSRVRAGECGVRPCRPVNRHVVGNVLGTRLLWCSEFVPSVTLVLLLSFPRAAVSIKHISTVTPCLVLHYHTSHISCVFVYLYYIKTVRFASWV